MSSATEEDPATARRRERRPNASWKAMKALAKRGLAGLGYKVERIHTTPAEEALVVSLNRLVERDPTTFFADMTRHKRVLFGQDWGRWQAHLESGHFRWGVPQGVDLARCESNVTYTEVLAFMAYALPVPVRYLEIGASVGMNFLPLMTRFDTGLLAAVDIEHPFPVFANALQGGERIAAWEGSALDRHGAEITRRFYVDAHMPDPDFRQRFDAPETGPDVLYASADLFDDRIWQALRPAANGNRFNLIFSDAWHRPYAIRHEFDRLLAHDLIDPEAFIMVWDDLGGAMTDAFRAIVAEARRAFGADVGYGLLDVYGTYHVEARPHRIGYMFRTPGRDPLPRAG